MLPVLELERLSNALVPGGAYSSTPKRGCRKSIYIYVYSLFSHTHTHTLSHNVYRMTSKAGRNHSLVALYGKPVIFGAAWMSDLVQLECC